MSFHYYPHHSYVIVTYCFIVCTAHFLLLGTLLTPFYAERRLKLLVLTPSDAEHSCLTPITRRTLLSYVISEKNIAMYLQLTWHRFTWFYVLYESFYPKQRYHLYLLLPLLLNPVTARALMG